jgi:hypothetical protein
VRGLAQAEDDQRAEDMQARRLAVASAPLTQVPDDPQRSVSKGFKGVRRHEG